MLPSLTIFSLIIIIITFGFMKIFLRNLILLGRTNRQQPYCHAFGVAWRVIRWLDLLAIRTPLLTGLRVSSLSPRRMPNEESLLTESLNTLTNEEYLRLKSPGLSQLPGEPNIRQNVLQFLCNSLFHPFPRNVCQSHSNAFISPSVFIAAKTCLPNRFSAIDYSGLLSRKHVLAGRWLAIDYFGSGVISVYKNIKNSVSFIPLHDKILRTVRFWLYVVHHNSNSYHVYLLTKLTYISFYWFRRR
jgi:hypothetical protein